MGQFEKEPVVVNRCQTLMRQKHWVAVPIWVRDVHFILVLV